MMMAMVVVVMMVGATTRGRPVVAAVGRAAAGLQAMAHLPLSLVKIVSLADKKSHLSLIPRGGERAGLADDAVRELWPLPPLVDD